MQCRRIPYGVFVRKKQNSTGHERTADGRNSQVVTLEISPSRCERINLEEPHKMGVALRNSLEGLSEMRIPAGKVDSMAIRKILMPLGNMQSNNSIEHKCRFF